LHVGSVCYAHLCYGLTRIDLSFLEIPRSNWVVVIGLELLSLACPGLGLGSDYIHHFIPVSPCHGYGYLDPTSVENRIWGDGIGTCRCDANGSRLLSSVMLEAYG
jgi:hypothetical protein